MKLIRQLLCDHAYVFERLLPAASGRVALERCLRCDKTRKVQSKLALVKSDNRYLGG